MTTYPEYNSKQREATLCPERYAAQMIADISQALDAQTPWDVKTVDDYIGHGQV